MKNYIIGAIHFPPLPGYDEYPGYEVALANALTDLHALQDGGVSAVIIENNYDIPHVEHISSIARDEMIRLGRDIAKEATVPLGVSVLWNDYESAFIIAQAIGATFIRVPVFVDRVETSYGIMEPQADRVMEVQKNLHAEDIKIFADVHVKHATILSGNTIADAAKEAVQKGADVLIVTGKWTGDAPVLDDLKSVREAVGQDVPIVCGSGVDEKNVQTLLSIANGAIVSTSLKEDTTETHSENVKPYSVRIKKDKVVALMQALASV